MRGLAVRSCRISPALNPIHARPQDMRAGTDVEARTTKTMVSLPVQCKQHPSAIEPVRRPVRKCDGDPSQSPPQSRLTMAKASNVEDGFVIRLVSPPVLRITVRTHRFRSEQEVPKPPDGCCFFS